MALTVPAEQVASIRWLLELEDDQVAGFLNVLSDAGPQFNVFSLSTKISERVKLPAHRVVGALRVLASLYLTRDFSRSLDEFVDKDVFFALRTANAFSTEKDLSQWEKLRRLLKSALSYERSLGTAAKAGNVLTQHERIFHGVRIMTDLRPIFHVNVLEKPDAAVIIHMMKITQRDSLGKRAELFFALDHNDVIAMQKAIERALNKEQALRNTLKASNVSVIDPKSVY